MSHFPLVSICIPTYNGATFIAEALESAVYQTYSTLEIIISDDASNDDTLEIVKGFRDKTNIPIYIHHHIPKGIGANWNHCIDNAHGAYIKLLFQDDVLMPTCIEENIRAIKNDNSIGLIASKRDFIIDKDYESNEISSWIRKYGDLQHDFPFKKHKTGLELNRSHFKNEYLFKDPRNKIGEPPTVLFRKSMWAEVGKFNEDLKQILDYEFYYRILKKNKIVVLNKKLVKFRLHQQQATNINSKSGVDDFRKYEELIFKNFFWYLNWKHKLKLLRKYNKLVSLPFKLFNKFFNNSDSWKK